MLLQVFSIFDIKTKVFCKPFYSENTETALRAFTFAANDKEQDIGRWPEDFSLYHLGTFDDQKCTIATSDAPVHLAHANSLLKD